MAELLKVNGLSDVLAKLAALPDNLAKNGLRRATAAGAAIIRDEAKTLAPVYTGDVAAGHPPPGTLKRSIVQKQIPEKSGLYRQVFYVTVRKGRQYRNQGKKGTLSQDAFYWWWVELGTVKMAACPFMRPAFEAKKVEAVEAVRESLAQTIKEI